MDINPKKIKKKHTSFFRFKKLGDQYLITGPAGDFSFLSPQQFRDYTEGNLDKKGEKYQELVGKGFVDKESDKSRLVDKYRSKNELIYTGPILHIMVTTLRCNQACVYCHASAQDMEAKDTDMDKKTAKASLDKAFRTPAPLVILELQGGESLVNWELVKYIVTRAHQKSKDTGKDLELRLVTNMNLMDEEKYQFLLDNHVGLSTSLDGPPELHNKNRPYRGGGDNYQAVAKWVKRFRKDYPELKEKGYIWDISGVAVVSRYSLPYYKEIVDTYVDLGLSEVFFRPLNPFGVSDAVWQKISYSSEEFLDFYKKVLDYIIERNKQGTLIMERFTKFFLWKILTPTDPNMLELRSPCGAGIGQLAYNYNGDVYTCDEGRMVSMMGDESFKLGNVFQNTYEELVSSPVVRTLCTASCLEGLPGCSDCAYLPYCGTCPIYNYIEQGNIFPQMPKNERCKMNQGILDYLFEKLQDPETKKILASWVE